MSVCRDVEVCEAGGEGVGICGFGGGFGGGCGGGGGVCGEGEAEGAPILGGEGLAVGGGGGVG